MLIHLINWGILLIHLINGGSVRDQIACSGAIASTNCEIVARVFSDETHLMNGRNLRDPSMAAARVARLLIRHPHAPAVVRTATVARRMVWKQAAGCDAAQETKEEQRKILSQVSKRLQTMGSTLRWAVVQAAGHMCSRGPADIGQTQSRTKVRKRTKRTEPDKQQSETFRRQALTETG